MRRVLFVDDEPRVLQGLRRMLHPMGSEMTIELAQSGAEALERMASIDVDVLVTDMRMPGMDGAELLTLCKERHPSTARIVLSGHMELARALDSIGVAHQFRTKPCAAATLRGVLRQAIRLPDLVPDPELRRRLCGISAVPIDPSRYDAVIDALEDEDWILDKLQPVVESSPALVAKVLQLVNSAFVGVPNGVLDIGTALASIGPGVLGQLFRKVGIAQPVYDARWRPLSFATFETHAEIVARIAATIAGDPVRQAPSAATAARLHDIGVLLLHALDAETEEGVPREPRRAGHDTVRPSHHHGSVGAYVLGLWGLPSQVVDAVEFQHRPGSYRGRSVDVVTLVHVADALARELVPHPSTHSTPPELDEAHLDRLGWSSRIDDWRAVARNVVDEVMSHA